MLIPTNIFASLFLLSLAWQCHVQTDGAQKVAEQAVPDIACEEPEYQFGTLLNTEDVEHKFVIKNVGQAPLEIAEVRPSCFCAVADAPEKPIPPGGESTIAITVDLKNRKGSQDKTFTIVSNDPDSPIFTLRVKGEALAPVDLSSQRILFQAIGPETSVQSAIDIRSNTDQEVNITGVEANSERFTAEHQVIEEGKVHRVMVKTKPPLDLGRTRETLVIKTDSESNPEFYVQVHIDVVGEIRYSPKELLLYQNRANPAMRIIFVSPGTNRDFAIKTVEAPEGACSVKVMPLANNSFRIQLAEFDPSFDLEGKHLTITTDADEMGEIKIPFRIMQ